MNLQQRFQHNERKRTPKWYSDNRIAYLMNKFKRK